MAAPECFQSFRLFGSKQNLRRYFDEGRRFIGCEPDEDINFVVSKLGPDALVAASDMPHFDEAAHDDVLAEYVERSDLSPELLEKIVRTNAARLYKLDAAHGAAPKLAEVAAHGD